jgi:hypothetical protein
MFRVLSFFYVINLFLKILMYESSADFSDCFWLKGKACKTFDTMSTKSAFFKFGLWGVGLWEAATLQGGPPATRTPPPPPAYTTVPWACTAQRTANGACRNQQSGSLQPSVPYDG